MTKNNRSYILQDRKEAEVLTYVHLAGGVVIAQTLFPGDNQALLAVSAGAVLPDIPQLVQFGLDKLGGRPPLQKQSRTFVRINNIDHSLIVWLITLLSWPLFIGIYSHLLLDWASHKAAKFRVTDPGMLWPLPWKLRGVFEYRKEHGKLFSPIEMGITAVSIILFVALRALG